MLKIVLMLIAALAILACGGDDTDEIVGSWKMTLHNVQMYTHNNVELGSITFHYTFDNNGRVTETMEGFDTAHTVHGTYFVDGNLLQLNFDGVIAVITFSINGNLMTWVRTIAGEQQTTILERDYNLYSP